MSEQPTQLYYVVNARMPTEKAHGYQIVEMCGAWAQLGMRVTLVAPHRVQHDASTRVDGHSLFSYYHIAENFTVRVLRSWDALRFERALGRLAYYLQALCFWLCVAVLRVPRAAIVYTRNPGIAWLMRLRGFATAYECHDWFSHPARALFFLKKIPWIVVTNTAIKQQFIASGFAPQRVLVARNGVDLALFDQPITKAAAVAHLRAQFERAHEQCVLLYTGSLRTKGVEKGIDEIIDALALLHDPSFVFVAVGASEEDARFYQEQATARGVLHQTFFLPRVDHRELVWYYKAADVLLMPFPRRAHYEYHMSPLKLFEYMAVSRAIIASDLPSLREVLDEESAFFIPAGDASALARAIALLRDDGALRERLARAARSRVAPYGWNARARSIRDFIVS